MGNREIFRAEGLPVLQNKTFATAAEAQASPTGDVVLVQDARTGLIYNHAFDASRIVYDRDYQNEQAYSPTFQRHLDDVASIVARHWTGKSLLEIGCGKGYFLEHLRARGFDITGVDPAYEGSSSHVVKARFEKRLGLSADAIIMRHVLEHIQDPIALLAEIAAANGGHGQIYIEVPCFDWIASRRAWFDIFYEHVNYFRMQDFSRLFGCVYESGHVFGGQYLYVVAELASLRTPVAGREDLFQMPDDFLSSVNGAIARARSWPGARKVLWGGASKGVIFSLYLQRAGVAVDAVIDINPAKQGRYLGVTGLRVSAPEDALPQLSRDDAIFVMNSNYLQEIVAATGNRFSYLTVDDEGV
jgi:SAM-dependent methyltransferase